MTFLKPITYSLESNPFVVDLGNEISGLEWLELLQRLPDYSEAERSHSRASRKLYTHRLFNFFVPTFEQIQFAQRLHETLKNGYAGRDPRFTNYVTGLPTRQSMQSENFVERCSKPAALNTARSFSVIGSPGMGKSVAADRILRCYPQGREVVTDFLVHQLVWVKLECPRNGSLRQLCLSFFQIVDSLLGSEYYSKYHRMAVDSMVVQMSIIARTHALGVLVIDEIQHLAARHGNGTQLLNFVTQLVNQIEIPVIMIGTEDAEQLFEASVVQGRRASGLGSIAFERFNNDEDWKAFVETTWSFQWTNVETALTPELIAELYDQTQGITDLFLTLYAMTQRAAMDDAALNGRDEEIITVELVRRTAKRELKLMQQALENIRKGRKAGDSFKQDLKTARASAEEMVDEFDRAEFRRERERVLKRAESTAEAVKTEQAPARSRRKKPEPALMSKTEEDAQSAQKAGLRPHQTIPRWKK